MTDRSESVKVLVKFGVEAHMQELRSRGILHMNRLDFFKRSEEPEPLRFDSWEGVDVVIQPGRGHIAINGRRFELAGPGLLRLGGPPPPHIFCAYAVTPTRAKAAVESGSLIVDARHAKMGSHALVILDVPAFRERAGTAFRAQSLGYSEGLIDYVANDHSGDLGAFRKRDIFRYQSEFRFAVHRYPDEVFRPEIGSLEDISVLVNAEDATSMEAQFSGEAEIT